MSWSDILYPDNPKRRAQVVSKLQKLEDYMAQNFRACNKLAEYLNANIDGADIPKIQVDGTKSLKENANILNEQNKLIGKVVEKIDEELKKQLDPELYRYVCFSV